jgi:hypothetical protein
MTYHLSDVDHLREVKVDEFDLTEADGEPSPRAEVQFTKFSVEMPLWIRLGLETTSPADSPSGWAAAAMVTALGSAIFAGVLGAFGGSPLLMALAGIAFLGLMGAFLYFIRRTKRHDGDSE